MMTDWILHKKNLSRDILQVADALVVADVRRSILHEQNEDRDEGKDDQVACVQSLPRRSAQVDRVEAHLHRVGRHEGASLAGRRG